MHTLSRRPLRWLVLVGVLTGILWIPAGISGTASARADEVSRLQKIERELDQLIVSLKKKKTKKHRHKKKVHHRKKHHHKTARHSRIKDRVVRIYYLKMIEDIQKTVIVKRQVVAVKQPTRTGKPNTKPSSKPKR
jgi:hypothetical protein